MLKEQKKLKILCEIVGWGLFIISAFFFLAASWRSGDMVSFFGALFFLIACFVFLLPYMIKE